MSEPPTVLILIGALWPGNDASGPNMSIKAMCEGMADRYSFRIIARDRPFGADQPMAVAGQWQDQGFAHMAYVPVGRGGAGGLAKMLRETPHELLVLNGFFDREFTLPALIARRFGRAGRAPVILSPRGEFSDGALALKSERKALFRTVARLLNLHRGVHFHVTSEAELTDCKAVMPDAAITLVPNFRPLFALPPHLPRPAGAPLRLAFLGRISPVKGLDHALLALARADVPAHFDVYGPVGDAAHMRECEALIAALPPHITVTVHGEISNADSADMLAAHDAMLLPSHSENFGHSIFESLASGTPVVIGDQTPWQALAAGHAGFDCPVGDIDALAAAIRTIGSHTPDTAAQWRAGARVRAEQFVASNDAATAMTQLFEALITGKTDDQDQ